MRSFAVGNDDVTRVETASYADSELKHKDKCETASDGTTRHCAFQDYGIPTKDETWRLFDLDEMCILSD